MVFGWSKIRVVFFAALVLTITAMLMVLRPYTQLPLVPQSFNNRTFAFPLPQPQPSTFVKESSDFPLPKSQPNPTFSNRKADAILPESEPNTAFSNNTSDATLPEVKPHSFSNGTFDSPLPESEPNTTLSNRTSDATLPNSQPYAFSNRTTDTPSQNAQPHILYILADDLGWNDVGYHGSFIKTPTIDKLAAGGVKLERFYVMPTCTPSRACLMTGRDITHTGLQHRHIQPTQPNALTLNATILPQVLRQYGYKNYMVGKWHLGFYATPYLPENRGFDRFFGILPGMADHYTRMVVGRYALVEDGKPYWDSKTYSTHLYIQKATEYVAQHLKDHPEKPMFLFLSFQAVHLPTQVPEAYSNIYKNTSGVRYWRRKVFAGMATAMDEGIRNITEFFKQRGIWDNTVMFFSTDNGGHKVIGGDNHPLRSGKGTLYEGGIRGVAFAHGRGIKPGSVSQDLMHISDVFPTIAHLAKPSNASPQRKQKLEVPKFDGFNMWPMLSRGAESPRKEILVNIDPLAPKYGTSQFPDIFDTRVRSAIIKGQWKLITGNPIRYFDRRPPKITDSNVQLYDLNSDLYEKHNVASSREDVVKFLLGRLQSYNRTAMLPSFPPMTNRWNELKVFLPYETNPTHLI